MTDHSAPHMGAVGCFQAHDERRLGGRMTGTADRPEVAYIATAPCGCTYAARMGAPDRAMLADAGQGAVIDRVTPDEARERLTFDCPHAPKWGGLS